MATGNRAAVLEALPLAAAKIRLQRRAMDLAAHEEQASRWVLYPHQLPPEGDDWDVWILFGGRGAGKTAGAAAWLDTHMQGPPCIPGIPGGHRAAIIAPTLGDALEACVNGPSGLKARNPRVTSAQSGGGTHVRWPNGSEARIFGASTPEDIERLRAGGNRCVAWAEELAAWRNLEECWQHMQFGLRLGSHPQVVASTTPKPRKLLKALLAHSKTAVTRGTTDDNPHLNATVRARLYAAYGGTRLGRQELGGELIEDVEGALWTTAMLEELRVAVAPELVRVVVAVDPSGGSEESNDEQGIVVAGAGIDGAAYILADRSCKLSPAGWGRRAVQAYIDFQADRLVYEKNFGGDMVELVVQSAARAMGVRVATRPVFASRGKQVRAEPIAALYERGEAHHVGQFPELEDELTEWTPRSGWSPNRLDGLVWAVTELLTDDGLPATATFEERVEISDY